MLMDQVKELQQRIDDAQSRYGVEEPDELRSLASAEDATVEDVREYKQAASEWESVLHELEIHRDALDRYDEFDRATVTA